MRSPIGVCPYCRKVIYEPYCCHCDKCPAFREHLQGFSKVRMLIRADARKIPLKSNTVDAIVTDPPYGLEFMGVAWDTFKDGSKGRARTRNEWEDFGSREHARHPSEVAGIMRNKAMALQKFSQEWAAEALRVAKPGAHLLAFGGTRTFHRLTCAIEDAGWEIRDCVMWLYGSGFPKSLNVSKAIDKAAGENRERIRGVRSGVVAGTYAQDAWSKEFKDSVLSSKPILDAAREWQGYGTALKPAWEPIIVARKPLDGTVAENVQKWGTGAIDVDGCRIDGKAWKRDTPTRNDIRGGNFIGSG